MLKTPQLPLFREPQKPRRGRPPKKGAGLAHTRRPQVDPRHPHHVTVRVRRDTWNLRTQRAFAHVGDAFAQVNEREGFRVTHFSVQGNHIHLIAEANDRRAMSNGVRALLIRIAKGLNAMMGVHGPRFADRFHERALTAPTQVRNALRYVLRNSEHHFGEDRARESDAFCSLAHGDLIAKPRSWLLRVGWERAGPLG